MTGLIGGTVDDAGLRAMASSLYQEDWYEFERTGESGRYVGVVEHGDRDADANAVWRGDGAVGAVYGVVSNRDRLGLSWDELFRGVLDPSRELLARLEGPFALVVADTRSGTVHVATDKAGSRPVYYASHRGLRVASEVSPLLASVSDPALDERAVSDLLLTGAVVGERTLVEGVAALPPATRLVYDGAVSTERYWSPEPAGIAPEGYPRLWLDAYRTAVGDLAATAGKLSLWLSDGAADRVAAGVLAERDYSFEALTDDAAGGAAARLAASLDAPARHLPRERDRDPVDAVERAVETTDGMVAWSGIDGLPPVTGELHRSADVVLSAGRYLGNHAWAGGLDADDSPVGALYEHQRMTAAGRVRALLAADTDPMASLRAVVDASVSGPAERTAVDAAHRLDAHSRHRARAVRRSQVGTRTVTHGPVVDAAVGMPTRYRVGTLRLSASLPTGPAPIRRAVVERLGDGPNGPSGRPVRGANRGGHGDYARRYAVDGRLQSFVDDRLEAAQDRELFDGDAVADLHAALVEGDTSVFPAVAAITGVEQWAQRHLESPRRTASLGGR